MNIFKSSDKVLIIGGTGFIGRHLVKRCLRDTPYVTCIGASEKRNKKSIDNVELIRVDITDKEQLQVAVKGKPFDYVFNLGGYIDHTTYFKGGHRLINSHFVGLMNLIDSLDINRLKGFIQIGSSDEYGSASAPQKEITRESPISSYSLAKTAASHFIQMLANTEGFPGVVLRLFLVYGPGQDDRRFLPQIIKACLKGEEFKTSEGKQLRDFCYVEDIVEAMVMAALCPGAKGHILNIASGTPISIKEMIERVTNMVGGGKPLWGSHPYRKGENMELYADVSLAKKILNWKTNTSLEDGLRKTMEYYRKTGEEL